MTVLDENVRHDQAEQLRRWRIPVRLLIEDLAPSGITDVNIIPLLHRRKRVVFFTHDSDFFKQSLRHRAYGLVWLDVLNKEAAEYIRRFLHHPLFDTQAKRMGKVVRATNQELRYWAMGEKGLLKAGWESP